jgi:hypothetical protein
VELADVPPVDFLFVETGKALRVLGLMPGYEEVDVVRAYRRRAASTHPDRGGDSVDFGDALEARDTLLRQLHRPRSVVVIVDDTSRWGSFTSWLVRRGRRPSRHLL